MPDPTNTDPTDVVPITKGILNVLLNAARHESFFVRGIRFKGAENQYEVTVADLRKSGNEVFLFDPHGNPVAR